MDCKASKQPENAKKEIEKQATQFIISTNKFSTEMHEKVTLIS